MKDLTLMGSEVEKIVIESLPTVLKEKLTSSYSNPLSKMIDEEITKEDGIIRKLVRDTLTDIVTKAEFKEKIANELLMEVIKKGFSR